MLQDAKDLQNKAVAELYSKAHGQKKELTFRAPTGSGKTRMMADFMNRLLAEQRDLVFLVSTLSKGNLAQQNYDTFLSCAQSGVFPELSPYLINTEISGEEELYIPTDYNVYVLPRDLYKAGGILMRGAFDCFLRTMTDGYIGTGKGKRIYLIKDECHQATNNLDDISGSYFGRIFNFSATPKLSRGQVPDVQISDEDAVAAKLIKRVELIEDENVTVDDAIDKFLEIKTQYNNLLGVHPCLIIQISNKDKAEEEWNDKIKPALDKHQALKWMVIVNTYKTTGAEDKAKELLCDTNDDVKKKLPVARWKDYAKGDNSTIDVIIFKMVISEGWDIPRACMLFQVRDTQSKQLDEQVMGRVRRNPRLSDFESLSEEAQELASTAWVWGIKPDSMKQIMPVRLWKLGNVNVQEQFRVKTTRLTDLTERKDFNIHSFMKTQNKPVAYQDIFSLYKKMKQGDNALQDMCFDYANEDYIQWWTFMEHYDKVKREYDTYVCDYAKSMVEDKEVSFPVNSTYMDSVNRHEIEDWIWCRKDSSSATFAFDSDAEREWANYLASKIAVREAAEVVKLGDDDERYLWGKNFPYNSEIKYEYYSTGIHKSYPDFILKDKRGRIHIFEVKSVNGNGAVGFDPQEYEAKINELKECYKAASAKLKNHLFYIPIKKGDDWQIFRYKDGEELPMTKQQFRASFNEG
ncbi:MAG: DEAD/DEAH box helicase family protein [Bacteroidaceae bacterium]|nr:DEAD/DEAH box helicase family protein [Bacteroidaceae bacterium]